MFNFKGKNIKLKVLKLTLFSFWGSWDTVSKEVTKFYKLEMPSTTWLQVLFYL